MIQWADIARSFVIGQAFIVFVLTAAVIYRYGRKLKQAPVGERALPAHVFCIAVSYLLLSIYAALDIRDRYNTPLTFRTPLAATAFIIGSAALIFLIIHLIVRQVLVKEVLSQARKEVDLALELQRKHEENKAALGQLSHEIADTHLEVEEAKGIATDTNERVQAVQSQLSDGREG